MRKLLAQFRSWLSGPGLYCVFFLVFFAGGAVLLCSLMGYTRLNAEGKATLFSGLLAGAIVWWQGHLLARQLAYGTVLDLYKEWNSAEMLKMRGNAWMANNESPNPETIEDVLEFLEKVSTLERDRYIPRRLIWDTFGWYVGRYYYYCKNDIAELRRKWTRESDTTLYRDLQHFYVRLIEFEAKERKLKSEDVEKKYDESKAKFIQSERMQ